MKRSLGSEFNETSVLNLISVLANRLNKNIDIAQYKYMVVFVYTSEPLNLLHQPSNLRDSVNDSSLVCSLNKAKKTIVSFHPEKRFFDLPLANFRKKFKY